MIFVIDYTISKFNLFINLNMTGRTKSDINPSDKKEKDNIIHRLFQIKKESYKDNLLDLIDNLINFFSVLEEGGKYYLKHYSFSSIWEDMVMHYLKENYSGVIDNKVVFSKNVKRTKFIKKTFYPNAANINQYVTIDHYYNDGITQLIFDAKYYIESKGMDYKQISYFLFLNEYRKNLCNEIDFKNTYSALFLPSRTRKSKIHFQMKPHYNWSNRNLIISEEYLSTKEVIKYYLNN